MTFRATWIAIAVLGQLVNVASAQEERELPSVRNGDAPLPANSALILDTPNGAPDVEVVSSTGEIIRGDTTDIANSGSRFYAWVPRRELEPGDYEVRFHPQQAGETLVTVQVSIIEAEITEQLTIESAPVATRMTVENEACCTTPRSQRLPSACFTTEQNVWLKLQPGLSAQDDLAVSDYVYRLRVPEGPPQGSADFVFTNLYDLTHAAFSEASEQYCAQLQALNIKTGRLAIYDDLAICAEGEEGPIGRHDVEVPDSALSMEVCPVPPYPYVEQWCMHNADACTPDAQAECELHAFVCDDGPLPEAWADSMSTAGMSGGAAPGDDAPGCGCRVAKPHARARGYALFVALGALLALRARGRKRTNVTRLDENGRAQ